MKKAKVSKYGQWKYPGQDTIIPNANGSITMKGVPYPVLGIDDLGNQQMMMPGVDYQFPGNSVYEIPMMAYGGDISIPSLRKVKVKSLPKAQSKSIVPIKSIRDFTRNQIKHYADRHKYYEDMGWSGDDAWDNAWQDAQYFNTGPVLDFQTFLPASDSGVRVPSGKRYPLEYIDINTYDPESLKLYYNTKDEVNDFYKNWYSKRAQLPQFTDVANKRLAGLNSIEVQPYGSNEEYIKKHPGTSGIYLGAPWLNRIDLPASSFDSPLILNHEVSHYLDYNFPQNSKGLFRPSYNKNDEVLNNIIPPEYKVPYGGLEGLKNYFATGDINFISSSDNTHLPSTVKKNFANASDAMPAQNFFDSPESFTDYYYNPTEIRARLNEWRMKNNIDPTKDYTNEEIQNIIDKDIERSDSTNFDLYKLVRGRGDLLKKIHDSQVSTGNKENPDEMPKAQSGIDWEAFKNPELGSRAKAAGWDTVEEYRNANWGYNTTPAGTPKADLPKFPTRVGPTKEAAVLDTKQKEEAKRRYEQQRLRGSYPNDPAGLPSVPIFEAAFMAPVALGSAGVSGLFGTELLGTGVTVGNVANPVFAAHGAYNFANPESDFRQALSAYNKGEGDWRDVAFEGGLNALNFLGAKALPGDIKAFRNPRAPQFNVSKPLQQVSKSKNPIFKHNPSELNSELLDNYVSSKLPKIGSEEDYLDFINSTFPKHTLVFRGSKGPNTKGKWFATNRKYANNYGQVKPALINTEDVFNMYDVRDAMTIPGELPEIHYAYNRGDDLNQSILSMLEFDHPELADALHKSPVRFGREAAYPDDSFYVRNEKDIHRLGSDNELKMFQDFINKKYNKQEGGQQEDELSLLTNRNRVFQDIIVDDEIVDQEIIPKAQAIGVKKPNFNQTLNIPLQFQQAPDLMNAHVNMPHNSGWGDFTTHRTPSVYDAVKSGNLFTIEESINKYLGYPMNKAYDAADRLAPEGEDPIDSFRHPTAAMYTQQAIKDKVGVPILGDALGFLGANASGIGHELSTLFDDERPWDVKLQEAGEDAFNNFAGSVVGLLPGTQDEKANLIYNMSLSNWLPDGVVSEDPNKNMYFKDEQNNVRRSTPIDMYNKMFQKKQGGSLRKAQNGLPKDYEKFLKYNETAPENRRPDSEWQYGNPRQYDHYGMWDALGKPENFDQALEMNPYWQPDPYDGMYNGFSTNPTTGVWLKSHIPGESHPGDTGWKEYKNFMLSNDPNWGSKNQNLVYDPELQRMRYINREQQGGLQKAQTTGLIEGINKMYGINQEPGLMDQLNSIMNPSTSKFNYARYRDAAAKYLGRDIFKGTPLTPDDIANAAQEFYNKTSYEYPLDLLLAQGQMESKLGKTLKSQHNYFNIGNTDEGAIKKFPSAKSSVLEYMNLMYNDYLDKGKKSPDDLLKPNGFVNYRGNRYASNPKYESDLAQQRTFIKKHIGL